VVHEPYFYIVPSDNLSTVGGGGISSRTSSNSIKEDLLDLESHHQELLASLNRLYKPLGLNRVEVMRKMDLDAANHLGVQSQTLGGRPVLKLVFDNVDQLSRVKRDVMEVLKRNKAKFAERVEFDMTDNAVGGAAGNNNVDPMDSIEDIREHDVPYIVRACIDLDLRAGCWYTLTPLKSGGVSLSEKDNLQKANPKVLAFDIECTKAPLKFPDADVDSIFMISYMMDGQGYLLLSRHVVGDDVANFEYTPKPKYPGPFIVMNELTEEDLIRRFLTEFQRHGPQIVVTYNGDFFDWPFLEKRAAVYGLDLRKEIGFYNSGGDNSSEYRGRTAVHLDAFCWVKRDSYLPQGSQGLKAVTKYKLGYDPVEVDPEDMVRYAKERPNHMASYSVSDAVATFYLYDKYVHMFIFSLCTIIPMGPEDVLRKGSGEFYSGFDALPFLKIYALSNPTDIFIPSKQT
jgi:DNA polymerase epsilon subunit 1